MYRVLRGGGWGSSGYSQTPGYRNGAITQHSQVAGFGFRVVAP